MTKTINKNLSKILLLFIISTIPFFLTSCIFDFIENDAPYRKATQMELDMFYKSVAYNNISICYKLDPKARKKEYRFEYESSFELRNHCFYKIAIQTKNPKICDEMSDISNMEETFNLYKGVCIKEASR